jgi:hypothetical protein
VESFDVAGSPADPFASNSGLPAPLLVVSGPYWYECGMGDANLVAGDSDNAECQRKAATGR